MNQRFIEIYISILVVLILYRFLMPTFWLQERFQDNDQEDNQSKHAMIEGDDADVYYTDNVNACKYPNTQFLDTKQQVPINYDYPQQYYGYLLQILRQKRGGSVQEVQERDMLMKKLQHIYDEYETFPDKQHCRLTIEDWKMIRSRHEPLYFGDIERNKLRGLPKDWAFVGSTEDQPDNPLTTKSAKGSVVKKWIDGKEYTHGSLKSFDYEAVKQYKQCDNPMKHNQNDDPIRNVLRIHPETLDAAVIRMDNQASTNVTQGEVIRYLFDVQNERVVKEGGVYKLFVQVNSQSLPLVRYVRDQCGRTRERKTFSALHITFPDEMLVLTRPQENGKEIRTMKEFMQELRDLQDQRAILVTEYNKLKADYEQYRVEYRTVTQTMYIQYFRMLQYYIRYPGISSWYQYYAQRQSAYDTAKQAYEQAAARKRELDTFMSSYANKSRDYDVRIAALDARIGWINHLFDEVYSNATREINFRLSQHKYVVNDRNVMYQQLSTDGYLYISMR